MRINWFEPSDIYKTVKKTFSADNAKSIKINGLCEYNRKAFCLGYYPVIEDGEIKKDENDAERIVYETHDCGNEFAKKILDKYKDGVTYLDAEWKGDIDLGLDSKFTAKSRYDDANMTEVYECLSNEFKFSDKFRQKTTGRELWEGRKNT